MESKKEVDHSQWFTEIVASSNNFPDSKISFEGAIINNSNPFWIILVLLFCFACLAISRSLYRKRFVMLYKTLGNWKLSKQIIRYEKVYTHPVNILMTINFIVIIPLFFSMIYAKIYDPSIDILPNYLLLIIPLIIYLLLKLATYQFSGWLWNEKPVIEEYLFQLNLFYKYLGVAFLILSCLLIYSPIDELTLAKTGLITLALFILFQTIRGVMIGLENGKHLFFIIAYLCTLEILPWLILGKWIKISL